MPYSDYEDESIYFSDDAAITNSFKTAFDNFWLDTTNYANYANASTVVLNMKSAIADTQPPPSLCIEPTIT